MKLADLARAAFGHYSRGEFRTAEQAARKALAAAPRNLGLLQLLAAALVGQGRANEAVNVLERAIKTGLPRGEILYNLGTALAAAGRHKEAAERLKEASVARPQDPDCHHNLGIALLFTRQYTEAEAVFTRALQLRPRWPSAAHNWARAVAAQGRHKDALSAYARLGGNGQSASAELLLDMGSSFRALNQFAESLACYDRALTLKPNLAEAHSGRANALFYLKRHAEALASYDRALSLKPDLVEAHHGRGSVLIELRRPAEALTSYDRALALNPELPEVHFGRGNALFYLTRSRDSIASYDRALALMPDLAEAHHCRGNALKAIQLFEEALASYERAFAIKPDNDNSLACYVQLASVMCDWSATVRAKTDLLVGRRNPIIEPWIIFAISDDPAVQRGIAEGYVKDRTIGEPRRIPPSQSARSQKLRLGYLSADFRQHPVGVLIAELIELHDRSRFEVIGFSASIDDQSAVRKRINNAFDTVVDVQEMSDVQLRNAIAEAHIDIIVDLGGHTTGGRILALAERTAPVQVTYLGYPGTVGAEFIDYAIVDSFVVPKDDARFFVEKLAYLPDCYLASDSKRPVAQHNPSRAEFGLSGGAFVFCCFNGPQKINAPVFDAWMHVLTAVPGSMLWLAHSNKWAAGNLRKEAQMRGVDPARLVFRPPLSYADHLAALKLADLFLDTWPYNAHTTANDALWAGLPVLTFSGRCFAARVAGSLLCAIGMPELVTRSPEEYQALAIKLAHERDVLKELRQRLAVNANTAPLFQSHRFARHIEAAFIEMWERYRRGERPESFTVEAAREATA
jgi:protein O-GlcNAc transferase